jgi:8-oxo-dGTP diphosphatase
MSWQPLAIGEWLCRHCSMIRRATGTGRALTRAASTQSATQARIGVAAHVFTKDCSRILVIKRGTEPAKGKWSVPGGKLELGESVHDCAIREALEETGVHCTPMLADWPVAFVTESITRDDSGAIRYHYVLLHVPCWLVDNEDEFSPLGMDDAESAQWARPLELGELGEFVEDLPKAVVECLKVATSCERVE